MDPQSSQLQPGQFFPLVWHRLENDAQKVAENG